jgi:hypothetical protein
VSVGEGDMEGVEAPGTKPRAAAAAIICADGGVWSMQSRRMIIDGSRSWNYTRQQFPQTPLKVRKLTALKTFACFSPRFSEIQISLPLAQFRCESEV